RPGSPSATRAGYFHGNDPAKWQASAAAFQDVDLGEVYPGIHVRLVARAAGIEKVLTVSPGASLDAVRISIEGGDVLEFESDGSLCATTEFGPVTISAPVASQRVGESSIAVPIEYRAEGRSYSFAAGEYDLGRELVVDPILQSTYLGGSGLDDLRAMAIAANGDVIVAGS